MADILNRLVNSGYWGKGHQNIDQLTNWIKNHIKENGVKVRKTSSRIGSSVVVGVLMFHGDEMKDNNKYPSHSHEFC